MGTDTFRRHTRTCVDTAIHNAFASLRHNLGRALFFDRLLRAVRARSDLMTHAPRERGEIVQVVALRNLSRWKRELVHDPESWAGATGHPVPVVGSLANHMFGHYPTPRFLGSAWFGGSAPDRLERRRWFIEHARGRRFRSLALPISMTRRMEDIFLRTPDHFTVDQALRRAEVLGLGGTPELAEVVLTTRIVECFNNPDLWRGALRWLVNCGDSVDLPQVRPVVDFLHANLRDVDLRGRTFASVMRLVHSWHLSLGTRRVKHVTWPRSRWNGMVVSVESTQHEPRCAEWSVVELLDSSELQHEGRTMRHCVAVYARACIAGRSSIWSLRHRWCDHDDAEQSVLTIEVHPWSRTIVQIRGKANARPSGWPLQLVRRWAARESLRIDRRVSVGDAADMQAA